VVHTTCSHFKSNKDIEIRLGEEDQNRDTAEALPTPHFSFPVCIPLFLLVEYLQLRSKNFKEDIAIVFHVDMAQQLLFYRMHLEHGLSIDINVGFIEIIMPEGQEIETQYHTNINNTTYNIKKTITKEGIQALAMSLMRRMKTTALGSKITP
jgi:hypothetical protein